MNNDIPLSSNLILKEAQRRILELENELLNYRILSSQLAQEIKKLKETKEIKEDI